MTREDPRLIEAKRKGITRILEMLNIDNLKRHGRELVGPCPKCFGDDRFSVNIQKELFHCRICGGSGDAIRLVEFVLDMTFKQALDWICGPVQHVSAEEAERRAREFAAKEAAKAKAEAEFRAQAIAQARKIWLAGVPAEDSPVRGYLALRGIARDLMPALPACLRFHPDLPYMVEGDAGAWVEVHRGPAMLAAVQGRDDRFCAVHRTWFDLAAPQGKARIGVNAKGEPLARKKSWGSKKGGSIRLVKGNAPVLVMGEGIETTLTAAISGVWPGAHFWAGVDLGNMSGQRHMGQGKKYAGIPDLGDADAFLPPPWVQHLVFVMDGDSEPRSTRAKLLAGLRRAMLKRPGLRAQIAPCPEGKDLNDVLLEGAA